MERVRKEASLLDQHERGLEIDENDLHTALLQQPQLYWQVSKQVALAKSRRDAAEQNLKVVEARTELNVRRSAREKKEDMTNPEVKSHVVMHLDVEKATTTLHALELEASQWSALERSFAQRMDALKKLVDLYLKNYWSESGLTGSQDSMKSHNAHLARRDMNAARRRSS